MPGKVGLSFGQGVKVTPVIFPERPSDDEYTEFEELTTSQTWTAPEDGWFQIDIVGASGHGTNSAEGVREIPGMVTRYYAKGGTGGGGGAVSRSVLSFHQGDTVAVTVTSTIVSFGSELSASSGKTSNGPYDRGDGVLMDGNAATGGEAKGGNIFNRNGEDGKLGTSSNSTDSYNSGHYEGGKGGLGAPPYLQHGGKGRGSRTNRTEGKSGKVVIFRGNTNIK